MTKLSEKDKFLIELNRLSIKKLRAESEVNKLGNHMFRLKNERLSFQKERARVEVMINTLVINFNKMEYTAKEKIQ